MRKFSTLMKTILQRLWPRTLKHALLLAMAILVLSSGAVISQIVTHRYSRSLAQEAIARAEKIAHNLALDATDKILINDLVALQKLLDDQMASEPAIGYLFIMRQSRILTHTFNDGVPVELIQANTVSDSQQGHLQKIVSDSGERFLDFAWPILNGEAGILRLGFSERPYRHKVAQLRLQMGLLTIGILLVTALLVQQFVDRLTRPLVALTAAVGAIDEGRLNARVQVQGRAEVSRLALAFNALLERLEEHTSRLGESNRQLAEKNRDLDRAQRQLRTTFRISRQIAAISDLREICTFLITSLKDIVECRQMALLIAGDTDQNSLWCTQSDEVALDLHAAESAHQLLQSTPEFTFLEPAALKAAAPPIELDSANKLAIFPMRHDDDLIGALVVGCPGQCRCIATELDVIRMILLQTAGAIRRALQQAQEINNLRARLESVTEFSGMVGRSPRMQVIYRLIEDVAPADATVLIQGESGTGKELVARAIHDRSLRRERPFVVINCSAYPSTLLESELFGHEKGAFTGAVRRKIGRFEQADGGTVFLDEIGEIPATAQIKLLRVLQSQKFERLGGEDTIGIDVRILAATNRNLMQEVQAGRFREDLYYRLNVIPIELPPLRSRGNDIPLLAGHFLKRFAAEQSKSIERFSSEAMRILMMYAWPGNVRELENSIEHAVVLAKHQVIEVGDLPAAPLEILHDARPRKPQQTISHNEEQLIRNVLEESGWNKTTAAGRLGISRSTLYEKLKKYRIQIGRPTLH
jgi:transcriptional regulator with GAF, ATPase, and Fis domain